MRPLIVGLLLLLPPSLASGAIPAPVGYVVPLELEKGDSLTGTCQSLITDGVVTDTLMQGWRKRISDGTFDRPMYDGFSEKSPMHLCAAAAYLDHFGTLDGIEDAHRAVRERDIYRFMVTREYFLSLTESKDRVAELESELQTLRQKYAADMQARTGQINYVIAENTDLLESTDRLIDDLDGARAELRARTSENHSLTKALAAANARAAELSATIDMLQRNRAETADALALERSAVSARDDLATDELAEEIKKSARLQAALEGVEAQLTAARAKGALDAGRITLLVRERDKLAEANGLAQKREKELRERVAALDAELASVRADIAMLGSIYKASVALKNHFVTEWQASEPDARQYVIYTAYAAGAFLALIALIIACVWWARKPAAIQFAEPEVDVDGTARHIVEDSEQIAGLQNDVVSLRGQLADANRAVGTLELELDEFRAERRSGEQSVPITHVPEVFSISDSEPRTVRRRIDRGGRNVPVLRYEVPFGLPGALEWVTEPHLVKLLRDNPLWCRERGIQLEEPMSTQGLDTP